MVDTVQLCKIVQDLTLTSERLSIRRFVADDSALEIAAQQDREVVKYIREPLTDEQARAFFEKVIAPYEGNEGEWAGFCVERSEDNQAVGAISFRIESSASEVAEIGYRFNPDFQGKGYAFEAVRCLVDFLFAQVKVHKVVAYCDPENLPSYKLMEKLAMQREGRLRQHYRLGEQFRDVYIYGLLASEHKI